MNHAIHRGIGRLSNIGPDSTNTTIGTGVGRPAGTDNVLIGYNAGAALVVSSQCVLIGSGAGATLDLTLNTLGQPVSNVTAVGYQAMGALTATGAFSFDHTAFGYKAGSETTTGYRNTFIGHQAGANPTYANGAATANNVVCIGYKATTTNNPSGATSVGSSAIAGGSSAVAVGDGATAWPSSVSIGSNCGSTQSNSVQIGVQSATSGGSNGVSVGYQAARSVTGSDNVALGYQALYSPNNNTSNATTTGARNVGVGRDTGFNSSTQRNDTVTIGYRAIVDGNNAVAIGSGASAGAAGAVAIGKDSGGTSASTTTTDGFRLGTASHIIEIPGVIQNITGGNEQTTVGASGAASSTPAAPEKYLKVKASNGTTYVIPLYLAS